MDGPYNNFFGGLKAGSCRRAICFSNVATRMERQRLQNEKWSTFFPSTRHSRTQWCLLVW